MTTTGERLAQLLDAYGIEIASGIPGTHTIELYRGLPATNIRHITPRHEQGAGFIADGYARVTGKPAACITVSGPGALNIATPMGQALADSVPMLVISADNKTYQRGLGEGRLHETPNLQAAMAECSRWSHTLARADELPRVLARAFAIFRSERPGPVHLTSPLDEITANADQVSAEPWDLPFPIAPLYRSTDDFVRIASEEAGRDLAWLFDVYLRESELPSLGTERRDGTLTLRWQVPGDRDFPMPVPVQVDGVTTLVETPGGEGTLAVAPGAHVVVDPRMEVLRRLPIIGSCEEARAEQAAAREARRQG